MRAAVIGLGRVGYLFGLEKKRVQPASHVECYGALENIEEIMLCDSDKKTLDAARLHFYITNEIKERFHFIDDYKKLDDFQPEIVSVCTPTFTHKQVVCDLLANKNQIKTIFLEKPIAQSLDEADAIIRACKRRKVNLAVNYTRRWSEFYHTVWQYASTLEITSIIGHHPGPLLRTGSHMLDVFSMFADDGPVLSVQAFGKPLMNYITKGSVDDYSINGVVNFKSIEATLISGEQNYLVFDFTVFGKKGAVHVGNNGAYFDMCLSADSSRYAGLKELRPVVRYDCAPAPDNPLFDAINQLVTHGSPIIWCSGETAKQTLAVALALHYSATHNFKIVHPEDVPKDYKVRSY